MPRERKKALSRRQRDWLSKYGPWAVVTGASSGIGREVARVLAGRGMNLVISARNYTRLHETADELTRTFGIETIIVTADFTSPEHRSRFLSEIEDVDVGLLVANAGFGTSGPFVDGSADDELSMIDVNVRAVAQQAHWFGTRFKTRGRGGIIFLSSIVSWQGVPGAANYAATKAYVQSLAEGLAIELRPFGVDVLSAAPAQVNSSFGDRSGMQFDGADPKTVARNTVKALGRVTTCYSHFMSRFLSTALAFLPRPVRVRVLGGVMRGMTAHQTKSGSLNGAL